MNYNALRKPRPPLHSVGEGTAGRQKAAAAPVRASGGSSKTEQPQESAATLCRPLQRDAGGGGGVVQYVSQGSAQEEQRWEYSVTLISVTNPKKSHPVISLVKTYCWVEFRI